MKNSFAALLITLSVVGLSVGALVYYSNQSEGAVSKSESDLSTNNGSEVKESAPVDEKHTDVNSVDNSSLSNPFVGKYFYVSRSFEKEFETFFETHEYYSAFYFVDNSTVIYSANINGWLKGVKGRYKYENGEIVLNIPGFFTGRSDSENFGGDVKVINDKEIIVSQSGEPYYKFLRWK